MAIDSKSKKSRFKLYEYLIILTILFSPYTQLRISVFGIPEVSIIILVVLLLSKKSIYFKKSFIFIKFWILYSFFMVVGLNYNYLLRSSPSGNINFMIYDTMAYIMVFVAVLGLECLFNNYKIKIDKEKMLHNAFFISAIAISILYVLSNFFNGIGGFTLKYYQYFSPLAKNLHHVSMILGPLFFIGIAVLEKQNLLIKKVVVIILLFFIGIAGINTGSSKFIFGIVLGTVIVFIYKIIEFKKINRREWIAILMVSCIVIICFMIINLQNILYLVQNIFTENDGGGARAELYNQAIEISKSNFFIGLGPGKHVMHNGEFFDVHQSFFACLLQGGIISLILFCILIFKIYKQLINDGIYLAAGICILIYALGGDVLRRLPIWILLICLYYCTKEKYNIKDNGVRK